MMRSGSSWCIVSAVAASVVIHVGAQSAPAFEVASIRLSKTGISGLFDVAVTWAPDTARANANRIGANEPAADPNAPDMFTALREQLGLRLDSQRAPVNLLVIEHVERPTEN
jgi:uncharacterized protein (TIGR03435 family)